MPDVDNELIGVYDLCYTKIKDYYISNRVYEVLLGSSDFARSFLTSEWLFKKYFTSEELDNTFIVAGYLKSIEQLLWSIIRIVAQGRLFRNVTIREENYNSINSTLGSIEFFFKNPHNADLFRTAFGDNQHYVIKYLLNQIGSWRTQYRNGLFHKEQLNKLETINTIRQETIYLYLLILGSLHLSPENTERLKS